MSRGVVLWPDLATELAITELWDALASAGQPSLASHTHRRHRPHLSLLVADDLPIDLTLATLAELPIDALSTRIESIGVFPGSGESDGLTVLFAACTITEQLLATHSHVHKAILPLATGASRYFAPGCWTPHITLGYGYSTSQLAQAITIALERLPLTGTLDRAGVEDGTTGESWPAR